MRVLLDMNLPPRLVGLLAEHGIESIHWSSVGAHDAEDIEIMAYAGENGYVVVSCDLDFSAILSATHSAVPSVAQVRLYGLEIEQIATLVANALKQHDSEIGNGAIITVDIRRSRVRLLPI